jgi:hypothetical protein
MWRVANGLLFVALALFQNCNVLSKKKDFLNILIHTFQLKTWNILITEGQGYDAMKF